MVKIIFVCLILTSCVFGGSNNPERKNSYSCADDQLACVSIRESCVKDKCSTSVEVICHPDSGDGRRTWHNKTNKIGDITMILHCQVSNNGS